MDIKVKDLRPARYGRTWDSRGSDHPMAPSRVYVSVEGETLWADFANRTSRPYNLWKPLVAEALEGIGIKVEKLRWSRYAGCSMCACSPGFVIEAGAERGRDFWVTIVADEPQRTDDVEALMRFESLANDPTIPVA